MDPRRTWKIRSVVFVSDPMLLAMAAPGGTFVGEPDTLITKCPSKFTTESNA